MTTPNYLSVISMLPSITAPLIHSQVLHCLLPGCCLSQSVSTYLPIMPPSVSYQTSVSSTSNQPLLVSTSNTQHLWNETLPLDQKFTILSQLFSEVMEEKHNIKVPIDFLKLTAAGMVHLLPCNRGNVIYLLAQAFGSMRADESDSLLPAKRMPMGLIEHTVNFLNVDCNFQISGLMAAIPSAEVLET